MLYELAEHVSHLLTSGVTTTTPVGGDEAVKVAIVTALGIVMAAAITGIASTFQRHRSSRSTVPSSDNFNRAYVDVLKRDQRELLKLRVDHRKLREAALAHGFDPDDWIREQGQ